VLVSFPPKASVTQLQEGAQFTPNAAHRDHCTSVNANELSALFCREMRMSIASWPGAGNWNASLSSSTYALFPLTYTLMIGVTDAKVLVPSAQNRTKSTCKP
jgi:hypothetical protein